MDPYSLRFEQFSKERPWLFTKVADLDELNRLVAGEVVSMLKIAAAEKTRLLIICPVGPLDYSYWAERMNEAQTDGSLLSIMNMDEYINGNGDLLEEDHPMSFRRFMRDGLYSRLKGKSRIPPENIYFPSPHEPELSTRLIENHGGADICFGGMGMTDHFAFNDPPPPCEPCDDSAVRTSRTRTLTIGRESQTQMAMGGTGGNWEILPSRAVTLGMYELLLSKKIHLTFMRSWHAGVLRRALFGPVTGRCPGSFVQEHPNLQITLTDLAADLPQVYLRQSTAAA
jgi:glucosamine-6-phosphate deaminase